MWHKLYLLPALINLLLFGACTVCRGRGLANSASKNSKTWTQKQPWQWKCCQV